MPKAKQRDPRTMAEIAALLAALSGRGRYIASRLSGAGHGDPHEMLCSSDGTAVPCSRAALEGARQRGWVAPVGDAGRLGLTAAGREALRRSRSRLAAARAEAASALAATPATPTSNSSESPLAWLANRQDAAGRPMLAPTLVSAGERFRADLTFAGLTPRVTMNWSGIPISGDRGAGAAGFGRDLADNIIAARARVEAAIRAIGPELSDILIDVCGHLRGLEEISRTEGWPRHAARLLLQRALAALARHYGLEPEVRPEETLARRLRHWGAEDYRPTLARWRGAGTQTD